MPLQRILLIAGSIMAACSAHCAALPASEPSGHSGYYRYPALHGDTVVFTSEGDLWSVGIHGGAARRLTSGSGDLRRRRCTAQSGAGFTEARDQQRPAAGTAAAGLSEQGLSVQSLTHL